MDHTEVEWQFEADDLAEVEGWISGRPDLRPSGVVEMLDSYLDTEDWRLYRAGYALRIRRSNGGLEATMKALAPAMDGVRRRREITEPLQSGGPRELIGAPGPLGESLRPLLGGREPKEIFGVRTRRRTFLILPGGALADAAGGVPRRKSGAAQALGEIALDEAGISVGGGTPARLLRVEIEASPAAPDDAAAAVAREMREALGLRPAAVSKFGWGLSIAGLAPPGEPGRPRQ